MPTKEIKRFRKVRLHKVAKELNLTIDTIVDHLKVHGSDSALSGKGLNAAIGDEETYLDLLEHFSDDLHTRARVRELRAARESELAAILLERQAEEDAAAVEPAATGPEPPATGPEPPATGPEPPATGPEPAATGPEPPATGPEPPATGPEPPATGPEPAATGPEPPATGPEPPATGPEPPATGPEPAATGPEPPAAGPEPPAAGPEPPATGPEPPAAGPEPPATGPEPAATGPEPPAAAPEPPATGPEPPATGPEPPATGPQTKAAEDAVVEEPAASAAPADEEVALAEGAAAAEAAATPVEAAESETAAPAEAALPAPADEAEVPDVALPAEEPVSEPVAEGTLAEEEPAAGELPEQEEPSAAGQEARAGGQEAEASVISAARYKLQGTTVVGTLDLATVEDKAPVPAKRKRKRKRKSGTDAATAPMTAPGAADAKLSRKKAKKRKARADGSEAGQKVQETLQGLDKGTARVRQRRRRARRQQRAEERRSEREEKAEQEKLIRVTEFVSTGELASLMGIAVTDVIGMLFSAGMMVSINQRLDADTISFVADDFGYEVEFITDFGTEDIEIEEDALENLVPRAPVVTVMGHVDHGKTSLLDFVRNANVAIGESGGITQHIGAYQVELPNKREVTFLDTPGHEAFTAMRARGAKVTDVVILVVAADDAVMPQTVEAINHARAAEVALIVAINKCDLPDANVSHVVQQLSEHGVLVEQYGGNVQCAEVSAKTGQGVEDLLEKVMLEADLLELQCNPDRRALGIVIESRLDRGRGNIATVLVQNGTLCVGDPFVAGIYGGRVRAMFDERDQRITEAGPSEPALVLGLPGQPNVGDQFIGVEDESEARDISQRRQQIWREQRMRQYKHVRLEDVGRRMALGDLSELNLIIKADVGGSVEAISDSLQKLSTDEVAVNIIHSAVGAINDSDVMLASASDAVIIGFQVRPTAGARTAAEREEIDIRTYSIIYDALEDVRDALEGLLTPEETEKVIGVVEIRELFRVPKVGVIAGSYVSEGRVRRHESVRVVREGVVIYDGRISSLKRFKEDAREVVSGYECGIGVANFNDVKVGDQIEAYEIVETKRTLDA